MEKLNRVINRDVPPSLHKEKKDLNRCLPLDCILMFKMLILQRIHNLKDDQTEYQMNDRMSFMRFLGLGLEDRVADSKTIWLVYYGWKNITTGGKRLTPFTIFMSLWDYFKEVGETIVDVFDGETADDKEHKELYYYYKKLYERAVEDEIRYRRLSEEYRRQLKSAKSQRDRLKSNKKYYEKRAEDLESIIKRLETDGGLFNTFVPDAIGGAKDSIQDVETTYSSAIKVTKANNVYRPINAFDVKSVDEEFNSRKAHEEYRRVLSNMKRSLSDTKSQINRLENDIDRLGDLIDVSEDKRREAAGNIIKYAFERDYHKARSKF